MDYRQHTSGMKESHYMGQMDALLETVFNNGWMGEYVCWSIAATHKTILYRLF